MPSAFLKDPIAVLDYKFDWKALTKAINGGYIGLEDRIKHTNEAYSVIV